MAPELGASYHSADEAVRGGGRMYLDPEAMRQRSADMQAASVRAARTAYSQSAELGGLELPRADPMEAGKLWRDTYGHLCVSRGVPEFSGESAPAWRAPVVAMALLMLVAAAVHFLFRHWSH